MPNTPAVVQAAASAFSMGASCKEGDSELVRDLLSTVGYAVEVPEVMMDPVTGLSGSGPSYVNSFTAYGFYVPQFLISVLKKCSLTLLIKLYCPF